MTKAEKSQPYSSSVNFKTYVVPLYELLTVLSKGHA